MKISIFIKTFFILLLSFSFLFIASTYYFNNRFSQKYVEENIRIVKEAIINSAEEIKNNTTLNQTLLDNASSETQFILYQNNQVVEMIGPQTLREDQIILFLIELYDSKALITEGNLSYTIALSEDIYSVSYIYKFGQSDYLLVLTKIQSLRNIDKVMEDITITQALFIFFTITIISLLISLNIANPIKRINRYAKSISQLDFSKELVLKRKDEFSDLISSLNEMAFNLKNTYAKLNDANKRLLKDIEFEKQQEKKKKALIMTINHEIRTPLSVIKGMIEGMIDGIGRYKHKDNYLKEVLVQINSIEDMIKDLTYSLKLEDKAKKDDLCQLSALNQNLLGVIEYARQKKVRVSVDIEDSQVNINEELLSIMIINLMKNAINYTENSLVVLQTKNYHDKVEIIVKNKGFIKESDLDKIFEPYYRLDFSEEGLGVGLFIVKQICEIYNCDYKIYNDNSYVIAKVVLKKPLLT